MKHKIWFRLASLSCLWLFFTVMGYGMVGIVNLFGTDEGKSMMLKYMNNELNTPLFVIMSIGSIFAISIIATLMMGLAKDSDKFDKLDEEIALYQKATRRLNQKIHEVFKKTD